jgi:hypothetical protein
VAVATTTVVATTTAAARTTARTTPEAVRLYPISRSQHPG